MKRLVASRVAARGDARRRGALRWSAAALLLLASCGGEWEASTDHQESGSSGSPSASGVPLVQASSLGIADARDVLHSARRLVRLPDGREFVELLTSDGEGRFALEAVAPAGAQFEQWDLFVLLQQLRQAYAVRYRDFAVRDLAVLQGEWSLYVPGSTVTVAGRTCDRLDVVHLRSGRRYQLSVDQGTGLVLDQVERDAGGALLLQVTYQDLDLSPNLSNVVWHEPMPRVEYALDGDFEAAFGFELQLPTNLPPGYVLHEVVALESQERGDPEGPWIRVTYTNGVDPLFYALSVPSAQAAIAGARGDVNLRGVVGKFLVFSLGRTTAARAELSHGAVIGAGRVSADELQDLLHSAIPE